MQKKNISEGPSFNEGNYNRISDKSLDISNIAQELEKNKDESFLSDALSNRNLFSARENSNQLQQQSFEMSPLKPLRNNDDLNLTKRRLNSVVEEVEEEDLNNNPIHLPHNFNSINSNINLNNRRESKLKTFLKSFSSHGKSFNEKLSVRYQMSPSIANNSMILKPDIRVHGVNFKDELEKSPKNYEWLLKRERSSLRGLGGLMMMNHMKFLKVNSNLNISIYPLIKSIVFVLIDALQAIISIFSCILYIIDCYVTPDDYETLHFLHTAELVITIISTVDMARQFLEAKDKVSFCFKIHTLIDLIATLPYYISLMAPMENSFNFLHILQLFKLVRILRLYRLFNDPDIESSDQINEVRFSFERQISIFLCTLFATLFIFSGMSYELNAIFEETYLLKNYNTINNTFVESKNNYTFFYAFYFFFQTFLTVGYGDISPIQASSRIFVCLVIIIYLVIFVDQVYKLWEIKTKISPYDFDFKGRDHFVIIGYFNENSLQRMLLELYREETFSEKDVLIIRSSPPSAEILILIEKFRNQQNEASISYLQCSFMKDDIIMKANIKKAKAIFLMNDPNITPNDNEIVMLLKLFQDYNPFIRKIVQINEQNIITRMSPLANPWNIYFSPNKLKISLLVNSIFNKGVITLFSNLMASRRFVPQIKTTVECQWFMEYSASYMQNVFVVPFSSFFYKKRFKQAASIIYKSKSKYDYVQGILLVGVKKFPKFEEQHGIIYINPQNYSINNGDHAIVIAKDKETAQFVSYFIEEVERTNTTTALIVKKSILEPINDISTSCENELEGYLAEEFARKKNLYNNYEMKKFNSFHILLWKSDITTRLKGHIIVFSHEKEFEEITLEIRKKTDKPVCFWIEKTPSQRTLDIISRYPKVFIFEGNILNLDHLNHANISQAYHVLIFAQKLDDISYNMDSKAVLLSNILEEFFAVPYTMEISDVSELKLLGFRAKKEFNNLGMNFEPHFMAGNVLPSNIFDSLSVYLLDNEILLELLKNLFNFKDKYDKKEENIDFFENKELYSINCPPNFYGKNYEEFILKVFSCNICIVPLGVLTKKFTKMDFHKLKLLINNNKNENMNFLIGSPTSPHKKSNQIYDYDSDPRIIKLPLFLLNPLPTTVLSQGDVIIVIGEIKKEKNFIHCINEEIFSISIEEEIFQREGIKEKNTEKFQEIVGNLKRKLLNEGALEEIFHQKNEIIDNLEKVIEQQKDILKKMRNGDCLSKLSSEIAEESKLD